MPDHAPLKTAPHSDVLRLKGRAVLKIIDQSAKRKLSLAVRLAVSDSTVKCIHSKSPYLSISVSFRISSHQVFIHYNKHYDALA